MQPISFFAAGIPRGQPRPKAFSRGGHASVYDPATAEGWKSQVAIAAKEHLPSSPIESALTLSLTFYIGRPKSHHRTGKHHGELRADAPKYHTSKPDADNFAKAVMDAMTLLRFWQDDSQVCILRVAKRYANGPTGCVIEIKEAPTS